jgi:hypothetical protein
MSASLELTPPSTYWIAVDDDFPLAAWQLRTTGQIVSAAFAMLDLDASFQSKYEAGTVDYLPFTDTNPGWDLRAMSPYFVRVLTSYGVEYNAELVRRQVDGRLPSRLSATFACGTKTAALKLAALENYRRTVRKFELVEHALNRVCRVNMDIVSMMRETSRSATWNPPELEAIWKHYWSGGGGLEVEVPSVRLGERKRIEVGATWEYLIEGVLGLAE